MCTASSGHRATHGGCRWVGWLAIAVLLGAATLGCSSGGATSNAEASTTTAPVEITVTTVDPELGVTPDLGPPASCGDMDAEFVTRTLGEEARFLGVDASGCGFTAGLWTLGVRVEPHDPATNGELRTSPSLNGTTVPNQTFLTNDRSGFWFANSALIANGRLYTFQLRNTARGADTYPPTDGEPQRPVTESAALRLIDGIAATGS